VGFGLWLDEANGIAWAQGTQEYRAMGAAAIAITGQFRICDFQPGRPLPAELKRSFAGFFGSLEEVNRQLKQRRRWRRTTPAWLR
jgi:hypothetical protein